MTDQGSTPSLPESDRETRSTSRAKIRQSNRLFACGEALIVRIEASQSTDEDWEHLLEAAGGKSGKAELAGLIKRRFGPRYILDRISLGDRSIAIYIYATPLSSSRQHSLVWSLSTEANRRSESSIAWVLRADATAEEMRRWARSQVAGRDFETGVEVTSEWTPGRGVELTSSVDGTSEAEIRSEISVLRRRHVVIRDRLSVLLVVAVLLTAGAVLAWTLPLFQSVRSDKWAPAGVLTLYATMIWMLAATLLAGARGLRQELQSKESSLDLVGLLNDDEKRAFKLFQIDTLEIRRYYEQALRQRRFIFYVGIACIFAGFASVLAAFRLISGASQDQLSEKIVVASLGAIGGILANFVGLIFLRMFLTVVQSMVDFHKRLVATHHVVFANVLVAKIQDAETRDATLSTIAQELSRMTAADHIGSKDASQGDTQR